MFTKLKYGWESYKYLKEKGHLPKSFKWLLLGALAYLLFPFDLIPDVLPGIGELDDLIVVVSLLWTAWTKLRSATKKDPSIGRTVIEGESKPSPTPERGNH